MRSAASQEEPFCSVKVFCSVLEQRRCRAKCVSLGELERGSEPSPKREVLGVGERSGQLHLEVVMVPGISHKPQLLFMFLFVVQSCNSF